MRKRGWWRREDVKDKIYRVCFCCNCSGCKKVHGRENILRCYFLVFIFLVHNVILLSMGLWLLLWIDSECKRKRETKKKKIKKIIIKEIFIFLKASTKEWKLSRCLINSCIWLPCFAKSFGGGDRIYCLILSLYICVYNDSGSEEKKWYKKKLWVIKKFFFLDCELIFLFFFFFHYHLRYEIILMREFNIKCEDYHFWSGFLWGWRLNCVICFFLINDKKFLLIRNFFFFSIFFFPIVELCNF